MRNYRNVPILQVTPHVLVNHPSETGEGPLWDNATNTLTWNDIPAGTLFRYDPALDTNTVIYQHTGQIGGHTLQADGSLLIFGENGQILKWNDGQVETIVSEIEAVKGSRFNDVIADPDGNVYCGTMQLENGRAHLYRLDRNGELTLVWDDLLLSNGMGFSPNQKSFYLSDSDLRTLFRADYSHGDVSNREGLIRLDDENAVPDGMTVDAKGDIWLAVWDGNCLLHYSASGKLLDKVMFPVKKISSINFGLENHATAFVTTAGGPNRSGDDGALAGSLFCLQIPGVRGKGEFVSRVLI